MNAPIRRLSVLVGLLFASLLVSTTLIQYVFAASLNARPDNRRTLLSAYNRDRGPILVGTTTIAQSKQTKGGEFTWLRTYPQGKDYAHITGYFSFFGAAGGLELAENSLLSGRSDKLFYRRASDLITGRKPQGATLKLTINAAVQKAAVDALGGQRGAAVAIDPRTGAILAMVSNPTYDPNILSGHDLSAVEKAYAALNADPKKPLVNRAIGGNLYPPGSTFKIVTAAAALSTGRYAPDTQLPGPASLDLPQTTTNLDNANGRPCGSGTVTMTYALQQSCNTPFAYVGMQIGASALREQAARFGIGDELDIPLRVQPSTFPATLDEPQTAQSSIGGYEVRVSPLQMAMIAGAIGNNGVVMRPYLVQSVMGSDLSVIEEAQPERLSEAVTPTVAAQLTAMMRAVVEGGTGHNAQIPGVAVAGKTGTARHADGKAPHAWFISFAPADNPTIAVAVVVEEGGSAGQEAAGGTVSAPIARAMMEAALRK